MPRFEGKLALVTGAGSGIGAAITRRLASDGAKVIAADISGAQDALARELGPDSVISRHLDVMDESSVRALETWIRDEFGGLDILANNAGIGGPVAITHEYALEAADRVFSVNVRGAYMVLQAGLRLMMESGGGAVVNTASIGGFRATPLAGPYIISKGAVVMMTRVAAVEYATKGVRINAVAPGVIETPIIDGTDDVVREEFTRQIPMGRFGQASEVANVVAFLADGKEASHVTGQVWMVDGGRSAS